MQRLIILLFLAVSIFSCESDATKAERFFIKGNMALENGDYREAIRLYTEAIDKYPEFESAYNNRGVAQYKLGHYYEAIDDYTKLIMTMDALHWDARRNRVDANLAVGRGKDALQDLVFVEDFFPDSSDLLFKKGLAYFLEKDYRSSVVAFNTSFIKDSSNVEAVINAANAYFYNNDMQRAYAKLAQAEAMDSNQPNIYNTYCMMEIANGNYDKAMEYVQQALSIEPNNGIYLNNRGFLYLQNDDLDKAKADIDKAIVTNSENGWAYRNKGIYYYKTEKYEDAIRSFETAAKFEADMPLIDYYWGTTLAKQGKENEACQYLKKSVDRFENEGRALYQEICGKI